MAGITPSQTVGPYFAYGLTPRGKYDWKDTFGSDLITADASGERIRLEGQVLDGDGVPINDCMLEIWQADAQGRYASPADQRARPNTAFQGFGRTQTDGNGRYAFDTIKPGPVPGLNDEMQAPHIVIAVYARGMLRQSYTRIYFADEAANSKDAVLALVPAERRATLIAQKSVRDGRAVYSFDVRMQGDAETVFFEV
ncbi:MAG: protocatechuate 3,4-dioxygenase subunit alpha [Xanthobacteraceae bacterium]